LIFYIKLILNKLKNNLHLSVFNKDCGRTLKIMLKWCDFKLNIKFIKNIEKFDDYWPIELNISVKKFKFYNKKKKNTDSLILKLFLRLFSQILPYNYVFEVKKTKERIGELFLNKMFIQLPEGMTKYFSILRRIFGKISHSVSVLYLSCQITYGACCIQDCLGKNFGSSIVFHYGHSCLVSILNCILSVVYIFIEIKYDFSFLIQTIREFFCTDRDRLMITSTVQFSSELKIIKVYISMLFNILEIPQTKPLSPGEVLGCTSFLTEDQSGVVYIGDGKFHIESVLFFNPNIKIIQFNPFNKLLTLLGFKFTEIIIERESFIEKAIFFPKSCNFIFGALGRQGSVKILKTITFLATAHQIKPIIYVGTEINNNRLNTINGNFSNLWVQLSCPRISLDWGHYFKNLVITSFEFSIFMRSTKINKNFIPMDFYSKIGNFWTSYSGLKIQFNLHIPKKKYLIYKKYNYFKNFILLI